MRRPDPTLLRFRTVRAAACITQFGPDALQLEAVDLRVMFPAAMFDCIFRTL